MGQEWDWPPRQAEPEPVEGQIRAERIILPRAVPKRPAGWGKKLQSGFTTTVFSLVRVAVALALTGVLVGSLWLLIAIIRA